MKKLLYVTIPLMVAVLAIFASGDSDNDSIPNWVDQCPETAQLKPVPEDFKYKIAVNPERLSGEPKAWPVKWNGCEPDSDADGVKDSADYCPEDDAEMNSKGVAENGCPKHSDFDGTPDYRDKCPDTQKGVKTDRFGCPA